MAEHGGTHIDAPLHMWKSAWSVDEIPLDRLYNLALVVVDVTKKVEKEPDYAVSVLKTRTNRSRMIYCYRLF